MTDTPTEPAPQGHSYSTDVEGGAPVTARMDIAGVFEADYLDFVAGRANWLSLSGWARSAAAGRVEIVAAGPEALVGALEMACVLGPLDTLIESIDSQVVAERVLPGFVIRT
jgi:acylphosphatase